MKSCAPYDKLKMRGDPPRKQNDRALSYKEQEEYEMSKTKEELNAFAPEELEQVTGGMDPAQEETIARPTAPDGEGKAYSPKQWRDLLDYILKTR